MNEKKKCPNCGLLIDQDMEKCPYCGYMISDLEKNKVSNQNSVEEKPIEPVEEPKMAKVPYRTFLKFDDRHDVSLKKELGLFLLVFVGMQIIALAITLILGIYNPYLLSTRYGNGILNFSIYFIIFGFALFIINDDFRLLFTRFKKIRTYLYGLSYGFLMILVSGLYSLIVSVLFPEYTQNNNEVTIESIILIYPILSLIVFGFIGPFCEEMAYRVGLFSLIRRKNHLLAYVITLTVFGLIHFDFTSGNITIELLNLPSYMLSGLILCYVYDKEGVETSIITHAFNNIFAIIMTIIGSYL